MQCSARMREARGSMSSRRHVGGTAADRSRRGSSKTDLSFTADDRKARCAAAAEWSLSLWRGRCEFLKVR